MNEKIELNIFICLRMNAISGTMRIYNKMLQDVCKKLPDINQ